MSLNQKSQKNKPQVNTQRGKKPKAQTAQQVNMDQVRSAPETLSQEDVLRAQKKLGNQTVQRALNEEEEELIQAVPDVQRSSGGAGADAAITDQQGYLTEEISKKIQSSRGSGSTLPANLQEESSKNLGHDFKDVRVHTDSNADKLSRQVNAKAFTIGKDIFFKGGEFKPGSQKGRETLMHELTHVVQQSGSTHTSGRLRLGETNTPHEKEAEKLSKKGGDSTKAAASGVAGAVQRITKEELEAQMKTMGLDSQEHRDKMTQLEETGRTGPTELEDKVSGMNLGSEEHMAKLDNLDNRKRGGFNEFDLRAQRNKMGIGSESNLANLNKLDERQSQSTTRNFMQGKGSKDVSKGRLVAKINNPESTEEEVAQAKKQLNDLYGSKTNTFKEFFGAGMGSKEVGNRRNALKEAAQRGDEGAYDKYQAHKKANPSRWQKFKGAVSSGGKSLWKNKGKIGGFLGGLVSPGLQEKKKPEKKAEAPAPKTPGININMGGAGDGAGGGGDGGMASIMQEYSRVLEENKKLKEQLGQTGEKRDEEDAN